VRPYVYVRACGVCVCVCVCECGVCVCVCGCVFGCMHVSNTKQAMTPACKHAAYHGAGNDTYEHPKT